MTCGFRARGRSEVVGLANVAFNPYAVNWLKKIHHRHSKHTQPYRER